MRTTPLRLGISRCLLGDEVRFDLDYGAMLQAMTSPYVAKIYLNRAV